MLNLNWFGSRCPNDDVSHRRSILLFSPTKKRMCAKHSVALLVFFMFALMNRTCWETVWTQKLETNKMKFNCANRVNFSFSHGLEPLPPPITWSFAMKHMVRKMVRKTPERAQFTREHEHRMQSKQLCLCQRTTRPFQEHCAVHTFPSISPWRGFISFSFCP